MLFAAVIICGLWLLQNVFIHGYYKNMKEASILEAAGQLSRSYMAYDIADEEGRKKLVSEITAIAEKYDLFVNIAQLDGKTLYTDEPYKRGYGDSLKDSLSMSVFGVDPSYLVAQRILQEPEGKMLQYFEDDNSRPMFLYGEVISHSKKKDPAVMIVSSTLQPLDETVQLLSQQLLIVSTAIFALAFVLSFAISKRISLPLMNITSNARKLSSGNYDMVFETGNYYEANQLAHALNYATDGLKQVDKLRAELIANVSHDLRTPLTMIKAYAEMLRDISGSNEEKRNIHLGVIIRESDRLTMLVQDLLDVSKMQAGVMKVEARNFSLPEKLRETSERFSAVCENGGYKIEIDCPQVEVYADPLKISQVLYNLVSNAINYAGEDKKIYLSAELFDNHVRVYVKDTGAGIAAEDLPLIWDRYYKVDKEHKRCVAGTGIGLSIVKSALELHGMEYGVESTLGEGSTFWFDLRRQA